MRNGSASILCIERDASVVAALERALDGLGHRAVYVADIEAGLQAVARDPFDLVIAAYELSDGSGLDLLSALQRAGRRIPVIMTTSFQNAEHALSSMRHGAADVVTRPLRREAVCLAVRHTLELDRMRRVNEGIQQDLRSLSGDRAIVGSSAALRGVMDMVRSVAPTRATVLLEGESGTGKELFARATHEISPRASQPFVCVNCAALPEGLVESTLFGHERGAFTGATERATGAFERAHRGTLLLDEISEMRLDLQGKLLRAVQEQEFERVGGSDAVRVDTRLIATTNRDLWAEVEAGRFRNDLYYRLRVVPIRTPPLREHPEDIPELARHFALTLSAQLGMKPHVLEDDALQWLAAQPWPGNARELRNTIERAIILGRDRRISVELLELGVARTVPPSGAANGAGLAGDGAFDLRTLERAAIQRALAATQGHRGRAAALLGITERTLRNKLRAN